MNVLVDKQKLDILANAISDKSGEPVTMTLAEMVEAVDGIETGGGTPTLETVTKTYTPSTSAVTDTITPSSGYDGIEEVDVTVSAVPKSDAAGTIDSTSFFTENNQRKWKVTVRGYAESAGWVDEGVYGAGNDYYYMAVASGTSVTPTESSQTIGGANYMMEGAVTVAAMPTGTAGTPTATKGTVSNHSVSITPSVTNTSGYITGGTKTGTAVSVTASELVSGTYTISASGSHNVTNYATASVASGSATASATKGIVSNHSVSVTPSVTRTAGYITAGSASGAAVTVSASELVSGSQTITQNGTVDVTNLASVVVDVQGGGSTGPQMGQASRTLASASSSISFTGLQGEPTSFLLSCTTSLTTGASPFKVGAVVFDGTNLHGQIVTNTSNAQASYDGSSFSKTYSNGTLTVSSTGPYFQATEYVLDYSYGGTSANVVTQDKQVGSGATSIEFTNLPEATPLFYSVIFKSNFSTSSGYQRVMWVGNRLDGEGGFGMAMDSQANVRDDWNTYGIGTGSMTVTSNSTSQGGYFHQPGYYQLTAIYGDVEPQEVDVVPLSVTTNGTYTAPSGTAYSPVTVNVSGGGSTSNVVEGTFTASTTKGQAQTVNIPYTGNGYPIQISIEVDGGMYNSNNTAWYSTIQRYAVGLWFATKRLQSNSPDYSSSSTNNNCCVFVIYKNSSSNANNYTNSMTQSSAFFSTTTANASVNQCVKFTSKNTMSVFVASTSYGFMSGITYRYRIFYSS